MLKFFRTNNIIPNTIFSLSNRLCALHNCTRRYNTLMKQHVGQVMNGKTFKSMFKDYFPCKVICDDRDLSNYKSCLIKREGNCESGGTWFTKVKYIVDYIGVQKNKIVELELLDDETIFIGKTDCKTNSFIVKNIWDTYAFVEYLVQTDYEKFMI